MSRTPGSDDGGSLLARTIAQLSSASSARPRAVDIPKIPGALRLYRVTAYITGIMLLLLVAEMIVKYGMGYSLYAFAPDQPVLTFVAWNPANGNANLHGVDLSTGILIAHGWLYVLYLFADFRLWSLMRLSFTKFVQIALGGVIPFMSFIVEHIITKQVKAYLASREAADQLSASATTAAPTDTTASTNTEASH
jgi:integral membrane protein